MTADDQQPLDQRPAPKQGHTGSEGDGSWRPNDYRDLRDRMVGE